MSRLKRSHTAIDKQYEISKSLQNHWITAVLFGIILLFTTPNTPGALSIFIMILVAIIWVDSIIGIIKLRKLRKNLTNDPQAYLNKAVKKPILYHAYFWFLPR